MVLPLLHPPKGKIQSKTGTGSTFYPVEKGLNNGVLGCTLGKWKNPDQPYCAMRTTRNGKKSLCGKWVLVENIRSGATAWCKIMDLGPYGKVDKNGNWFNSAKDRKQAKLEGRSPRKGRYRNVIDMSKSVSDRLGSNGMLRVRVRWGFDSRLSEILDGFLVQ